ncbi:hypothetical protein QJS10_CPB17g01059 [Acorus calamus]|uniref:Uncharacterized protein n=1 Tax=Acorus calamus TaxID=4465 RepID=A0AAV9CWI3_ACOCL|nr:hypothetical protein QJS10_CPB17g01059 [Acorus calamus]
MPCLQEVEGLKWRTLRSLLSRNQAVGLERCLEEMKDLEARARGCYSKVVDMYSKDFVEMMLLDGYFIVSVLACEMDGTNQAEEEDGTPKVWMWAEKSILPVTKIERSDVKNHDLLPLYQPKSSTKGDPQSIPSAADLKEAGVKFKAKKNVTSFLDVTFYGRVMEIPPLAIYDMTESMPRNLIALERCYMNTGDHATRYALFMDCLARGPRDVSVLREEGIIMNWLSGDEEPARMFNSMSSSWRSSAIRGSTITFRDCSSKWVDFAG